MFERVVISECELGPSNGEGLAGRAYQLLENQKGTWEMLRKGYDSLGSVRVRTFEFDGFVVKLQFNPGRIVSSGAKIDPKTIKQRKCFLCPGHLPPEQRGLLFGGEYLVLCNPFPIMTEHFTIPSVHHTPQRIRGHFPQLLDLARDLGARYTAFYNGPKAGASAPDHMHFQAGEKGFMPVDSEYASVRDRFGRQVAGGKVRAYAVENYLRPFVSLESADRDALAAAFDALYAALETVAPAEDEPSMNVLVSYDAAAWRVVVLPRAKHRPACFFEEGDKRIMLSPGAVDLGGVCITPLETDFNKVTRDHLVQTFAEVCISPEQLRAIGDRLQSELR